MSNYTQSTFFAPKDSLSPGDPLKIIKGADFDPEFSAISTAIATKVDSATSAGGLVKSGVAMALDYTNLDVAAAADLATDRVAIYDTSATAMKYVTMNTFLALRTLTAGTGLTGGGTLAADRSFALSHLGIQSLTDPNADRIMFWDDSAGVVTWLAPSTGISISGTNITTNDAAIVHSALSGYVADQHVAHSGVSVTAGTGMTGGGAISASVTLNVIGGNGITAQADNIEMSGSYTGTFTASVDVRASSDRRLKDDLRVIENPLGTLDAITGYSYRRTDQGGLRQYGVIAQDVEAVAPYAVGVQNGYKTVSHNQLLAIVIEAVKELNRKIK